MNPHSTARVGGGAAVAAAAATLAFALGPAAPVAPAKSNCKSARIAGKHRCLTAGQSCTHRYEKQYVKYGFSCVKSGRQWRLVRNRLAF